MNRRAAQGNVAGKPVAGQGVSVGREGGWLESMKVQDIVDRLVDLGLDATEAQVFVHLCMMGPSKASAVATAAKIHRTDAYRTLHRLVQRGFVIASLERPVRFEAADPDRVFETMLAAQKAVQEGIERARLEISAALSTLRSETPSGSPSTSFRVLRGRQEVFRALDGMIRSTRSTFKAVTTHPAASTMAQAAGLWELVAERARAGLRVEAVMNAPREARPRLATLLAIPTVSIRHVDLDRLVRFFIRDDEELLILVASDPTGRLNSEADVAISTTAPDFLATELAFFESLWERATDIVAPPAAANSVVRGPTTS